MFNLVWRFLNLIININPVRTWFVLKQDSNLSSDSIWLYFSLYATSLSTFRHRILTRCITSVHDVHVCLVHVSSIQRSYTHVHLDTSNISRSNSYCSYASGVPAVSLMSTTPAKTPSCRTTSASTPRPKDRAPSLPRRRSNSKNTSTSIINPDRIVSSHAYSVTSALVSFFSSIESWFMACSLHDDIDSLAGPTKRW